MVYEYRCRDCLTIWETTHSIDVNDAVEELGLSCPTCHSTDIHKYLGNMKTVPIKFKGTGFASNDLALDKLGMPKNIRNNPEVKKKLSEL